MNSTQVGPDKALPFQIPAVLTIIQTRFSMNSGILSSLRHFSSVRPGESTCSSGGTAGSGSSICLPVQGPPSKSDTSPGPSLQCGLPTTAPPPAAALSAPHCTCQMLGQTYTIELPRVTNKQNSATQSHKHRPSCMLTVHEVWPPRHIPTM